MDQSIVNWLLGLFGALMCILARSLWQSVKDLQASDKELVEKVNSIEVLVAGQYIRRDEVEQFVRAIFKKLDKIEDKINRKEDKS